jgi:type III secretory pathway lipoprotein EscJ
MTQSPVARKKPVNPGLGSPRLKRALVYPFFIPLLLFISACGSQDIATVATEDEAIEILTVLYDNGIEAYKEEFGEEGATRWKILIKGKLFGSSDLATAHRILRNNGLPRPADEGREGAAKEDGLVKSDSSEKAKRLKEVEIEIERELRLLPSVVRVKVNVAPADSDKLELNPTQATAAVVIVCKDKQPTFNENQIQNLVAGSVPKLQPEGVRVMIAYEPPLPLVDRPLEEGRRKRLMIGIFVVSLLGLLLTVLVVQVRRKNGRAEDRTAAVEDGASEAPKS